MFHYIIRRLFLMIPILFGVSTLVFFIIHFVPGDPIDILMGETALDVNKEILRKALHLDKPLMVQYGYYLAGLIHGDLGVSLITNKPVLSTILSRYPATMQLSLAAMIIAVMIAIPLGVLAAVKKYSIIDNGSMFISLLGVSMPTFWLGPLLIVLFSIQFDILPVSGRDGITHIILPALTLGTALAGILTRMTRSSLLEVITNDYVRTARAKGMRESRVIFKHALMNALIPIITVLGLQFGVLLAGSIITESIFAWPGIGREIVTALQKRDYPMVQGCVLFISFTYVIVNLLTDIMYSIIDPRIRIG